MELSSGFAKLIYEIAKDLLRFARDNISVLPERSAETLSNHIMEAYRWSEIIQFYGMAEGKLTDTHTMKLRLSNQPRRLYKSAGEQLFYDDELLGTRRHLVLLGDPGSGKTTTTKRIFREIVQSEPTEHNSHIDLPILVVARDLGPGEAIASRIASILGVEYKEDEGTTRIGAQSKAERSRILLNFIVESMQDKRLLIIVDGIDEMQQEARLSLEQDVAQIINSLRNAQVILTCRSGDYVRQIEGCDVLEIQPLSDAEVRTISEMWASDLVLFLNEIGDKPYSDLITRPLFLCQIILIFNEYKSLPERAIEIYRRVVTLMLEKWDRERGLARATRYASFSVEQKMDFLSLLAHDLLRFRNARRFRETDVVAIYESNYKSFNIPKDQAHLVAQEIESHTGLIVASSIDRYEFCHLSLQEFLAANYLVHQPTLRLALTCLRRYPEPVAIAVCLSSDASEYLAQLMFAYRNSLVSDNDFGSMGGVLTSSGARTSAISGLCESRCSDPDDGTCVRRGNVGSNRQVDGQLSRPYRQRGC